MEDPDAQSGVPDTGTGLHCSIFVQTCKICFLKAMYVENTRLILSQFYVQLISPLHKCLTTPRCSTICSDPNSEALVSLSKPSGYRKPYQSLPLCCPASEPCFPTACYHFTISKPQGSFVLLYRILLPSQPPLPFDTAKTLVSLSFPPSSHVPASLSSSSQASCPTASCRSAGVRMDPVATWGFADICGNQQLLYLGGELTDPGITC